MAINIFLDTSFIVALVFKEDINHTRTQKIVKKFPDSTFYLNDLVKYESVNVICRKGTVKKAKETIKYLKQDKVNRITVDNEIWHDAFNNLVHNYSKNGPNVFNFIHFACMQKYSIQNVLTFDKHFQKFGFNMLT